MNKMDKYSVSSEEEESDQEQYGASPSKAKGSRRGPKPLDPRWTRVV